MSTLAPAFISSETMSVKPFLIASTSAVSPSCVMKNIRTTYSIPAVALASIHGEGWVCVCICLSVTTFSATTHNKVAQKSDTNGFSATLALLTLGAHVQRGLSCDGVCLSVCYPTCHFTSHQSLHKQSPRIQSDKGRKICGVFSETAASGSYAVKHERKRQ